MPVFQCSICFLLLCICYLICVSFIFGSVDLCVCAFVRWCVCVCVCVGVRVCVRVLLSERHFGPAYVLFVCLFVCVYVRACLLACVRARVRACFYCALRFCLSPCSKWFMCVFICEF